MKINILSELWVGIKCVFSRPVTLDKKTILKKANNTQFSIDKSKCIACRTCMRVCPNRCIEILDKEHFVFYKSKCSDCRLCQRFCPKNAIKYLMPS